MVVDGVAGLLGRPLRVHAGSESFLDCVATSPIVTNRRPACCENRVQLVSIPSTPFDPPTARGGGGGDWRTQDRGHDGQTRIRLGTVWIADAKHAQRRQPNGLVAGHGDGRSWRKRTLLLLGKSAVMASTAAPQGLWLSPVPLITPVNFKITW